MNIILIGPPGSGKGTQSDKLAKRFNLVKISTGELLRDEIKKKTPLGLKIKSTIESGSLAPDEITNKLIETLVSNKNNLNKLIFDGYPRNLSQAKSLDVLLKKNNQIISLVLNLKVDEDIIVKRILGRQICSNCGSTFNEFFNPSNFKTHKCDTKYLRKRSDDNEKTIKNRFSVYNNDTYPILRYYKECNLLREINAMNKIDQIYEEICQIINLMNTWLYNMYSYK